MWSDFNYPERERERQSAGILQEQTGGNKLGKCAKFQRLFAGRFAVCLAFVALFALPHFGKKKDGQFPDIY